MIVENKYVIVLHETGEYHFAEYVTAARIETLQEMIIEDSLLKIDVNKLPMLESDKIIDPIKIYNIDGVATCDVKFIPVKYIKTKI